MAYENIKLRKQNFTIVNGYFWMMDDDTDSVILKTDDGTTAFSYPLATTLSQSIICMEYDGRNIWTLRNTGTNTYAIDRWYINNYVCVLRNTFNLVSGASHTYSTNAFTVEHYHTSFSSDVSAGASILSVTDGSKMASGYKLFLGPNSLGQSEEVTVSSATSTSASINGTTSYSYSSGDSISFYKRIWLFNNYNGTDGSTGALYNIDAYTGSVVTKYAGGAYKDITACTFYGVPRYIFDRSSSATEPRYNSLIYIKGSTMVFLNPNDFNTSYGAMILDNIEDDSATVIPIYDLAIEGTNIYRLQRKATYYGSTGTFADSTYNYQLSTLEPFITSISLSANPAILPANGVNTSTITATVLDQFSLPIEGRDVTFTDDDPVGSVAPSTVFTNSNGQSTAIYTAGTSAREIRITATAQQT